MSEEDDILKDCRERLSRGRSLEEIISLLRDRGFSKVLSIKTLVDLGQANMSEAKRLVHESPIWSDVHERDEEFQSHLDDKAIRSPVKHCCEMMSGNAENICKDHPNRFDCPDLLIHYSEVYDEYGIIIHDGGESLISIAFCPWCGTKLRSPKRTI